MLILETLRVAIASLVANKGRALLSMLGVIIAVAAVITMLGIGAGAQQAVEERIASWGLNRLTVWGGGRVVQGTRRYVPVTVTDVEAIGREARDIESLVPEMYAQYQVKLDNVNASQWIDGTTPGYFGLYNMKPSAGRLFTAGELSNRRLVAVLGADAAEELEAGPEDIGADIRIRNITFTLVGILEATGTRSRPSPDEAVLIPITTAQYRLIGTEDVNRLNVLASTEEALLPLAEQIERTLRRQHRLLPHEGNDFTIRNDREIADVRNDTARTFSALLLSIAAVSLLVGGIGIMNIMLVSVNERTQEIGVRKALGARTTTILTQFLIESVLLCFAGGLLGIAFGYGVIGVVAGQAGWAVVITMRTVLLAVVFSLITGVVFGTYPALRAAQLSPVEALRYE